MKPVIIYFSNSGTTEKLAKRIGKDVGAKGIKVIPEKEYGEIGRASCRERV